jgi:hypothetical protein
MVPGNEGLRGNEFWFGLCFVEDDFLDEEEGNTETLKF